MVVENSGFGAQNAAPIARRVFDYVLQGEYPSEEDIAAVQLGQATRPIGKPRVAASVTWPVISPDRSSKSADANP
jgi:penicillin-binding protein 2